MNGKQEVVRKKPKLFKKMTQKKYSSSFSWQLSENKPNTKLVLLCLEFNKPNKQSVYYINLFKKINFFTLIITD